jgi:hypothetical protein
LDSGWKFKYCKKCFSRSRNSNFSFRIWWIYICQRNYSATELYDGTTWITSNLIQQQEELQLGGAGTRKAGSFWWIRHLGPVATEEFNSTIFSPATGAWASGGNLNTARHIFSRCRNSNCWISIWWFYWSKVVHK